MASDRLLSIAVALLLGVARELVEDADTLGCRSDCGRAARRTRFVRLRPRVVGLNKAREGVKQIGDVVGSEQREPLPGMVVAVRSQVGRAGGRRR